MGLRGGAPTLLLEDAVGPAGAARVAAVRGGQAAEALSFLFDLRVLVGQLLAARRLDRHWRSLADPLYGEIVELDRLGACRRVVAVAGALAVGALAVHPQHVVGAPVADDGRQAVRHGLGQLPNAIVAHQADGQLAVRRALGQLHLHAGQVALAVHGEGGGDLKRLVRVDARRAGPVICAGPVAGSIPRGATAVAAAHAAGVVRGVQGRVPGEHVRLLDVDLHAGDATHVVRVAVVVLAVGHLVVLVQRRQVQRRVAAAAGPGEVDGVSERLAEQVERHVVLVAEAAVDAPGSEVGTSFHVGDDRVAVLRLHDAGLLSGDVPLRVHEADGHLVVPARGEVSRAHGGGRRAGAGGRLLLAAHLLVPAAPLLLAVGPARLPVGVPRLAVEGVAGRRARSWRRRSRRSRWSRRRRGLAVVGHREVVEHDVLG